jgi:hypothetical protein
LLTLLAVIVAEILPSVHLTAFDIALGVVALVAANLGIATWGGGGVHFALLMAINFTLIYVGSHALSDRGNLPVATGLFFAYLTTLIVVLYDRYRPVRAARADRQTSEADDGTRTHHLLHGEQIKGGAGKADSAL